MVANVSKIYVQIFSETDINPVIISAKEVVVFRPCALVGLSAGLHKNYSAVFHKTWMEDGSWFRTELIN